MPHPRFARIILAAMGTEATASDVQPPPGPADRAARDEPPKKRPISRGRLIGVDALIVVATILGVVAMLSIWANRLLFNPDNWENTSTQLLQNDAIRSATANYVVDQLYANVNVAALIRSGLPPRLQPLAGPAAGALQNAAVQGVDLALTRPRIQTLWAKANRAAIQTFIAIVNGGKGAVRANNGAVTLNLASIVDTVAGRLGLPPDLGAKLPPNVGTLTVFKSDQLKLIQNGGKAIKGLALWLTILVPLLYGLAIVLAAGHRRRTLMSVGFAIVFAGLVGVAARHILESAIVNSLVNDEAMRPAARATVGIGTQILGTIAVAFILVGAVAVAAAWFAGPARIATAGRRAIAPFMRERPGPTFAIVTGVMVLVFIWNPIPATGTPVGIIVFLALALLGTGMLRRQTAEEFPDARRGDATAAVRARIQAFRDRRRRDGAPPAAAPPAAASISEQLERLAVLRDGGAITPEEYDAAKAKALHG
jgi:hypothetical protein